MLILNAFIIFILCFLFTCIIYTLFKMRQLNFFSDFMLRHLNSYYDNLTDTDDICYPYSIRKSYAKWERSMPWNYNFETMLVKNS